MAEQRFTASFISGGGIHLRLTESRDEAVMAKIRTCLLTARNEIPSQPSVGSDTLSMTFTLISLDKKAMMSNVVRADIMRNVPEITALNVSVDDVEGNANAVAITVTFTAYGNTQTVIEVLGG